METRRRLIMSIVKGGNDVIQVIINSEPTSRTACLTDVSTALGYQSGFFAWVDDEEYVLSDADTKCVGILVYRSKIEVFRNDTNYDYWRNIGSGTCKIPKGTTFKAVVLPFNS